MFFPTAGIEVPLWLPPLVAFGVSVFTSMGGVSGAFLLLPFQVSFLGYTDPSVSATNHIFNIAAIPSGAYRYWREGRMIWPLTCLVVAGTLPGVFIGGIVRVVYLSDPRAFKLFVAGVLLYVGVRMIRDLLHKGLDLLKKSNAETPLHKPMRGDNSAKPDPNSPREGAEPPVVITHFNHKRLGYAFCGEQFDVPSRGIFALSLAVGIVGGVYGIGGGAIIAPILVTFFRLPVYTVAGAALMGTFVTSLAGVAFYQAIAPFYPYTSVRPDWLLGGLFGLGGMVGMYLGARCQKFVPAKAIKCMLAVIIILTALRYVLEFFGRQWW